MQSNQSKFPNLASSSPEAIQELKNEINATIDQCLNPDQANPMPITSGVQDDETMKDKILWWFIAFCILSIIHAIMQTVCDRVVGLFIGIN